MNRFALILLLGVPTGANASNAVCLEPLEPLSFQISKEDPLYDAALAEHRQYLEDMEVYVNCLDRERFVALSMFTESFERFREFFGDDGTFIYEPDKAAEAPSPAD